MITDDILCDLADREERARSTEAYRAIDDLLTSYYDARQITIRANISLISESADVGARGLLFRVSRAIDDHFIQEILRAVRR